MADLRFLFACLVLMIVPLSPVAAGDGDAGLDALFAELKETHSPAEAAPIEAAIWKHWLTAGDAEADRLMTTGVAVMEAANLPLALHIFDQLVARSPGLAEAWNKRATVHYAMGHFRESVADILETLALEPRHFGALSGLGLVYATLGEPDRAVRAYEKALEIHPQLPGPRAYIEQVREERRGRAI